MPPGRGCGRGHRGGQRGPVVVPRNRQVDQEAPSRGLFVGIDCRKWASCPFFVSGADGGRMKDKLFGLLEPVVSGLGYELLDVEVGTSGRSALVRLYIDRTDGGAIGLDDCERTSR